ncbi:MAG: dTMP kinase [Dehalococcoidales bacterium]|nr:MAG: dTMP kinase [Dehalococcoidales bacterium]
MALFITFEGGEGSGKTAQARALHRKLARLNIPVVLLHEPGGTSLGRRIARWLKWVQDAEMSPLSELLLFNASRAQLVAEVIRPNLVNGKVVICDRYTDSTIVYQGYGRGLDMELVRATNGAATGGLVPDLTVLLDVPVEEGFARKCVKARDRFEQEDIAFHQRVGEGYLKLAQAEPERWLVIDGCQSRARIAQIIWGRVSQLLGGVGVGGA